MPPKHDVHLRASERQQLEALVKQGHTSARQINRARILLVADAQIRDEDIAATLGVSHTTIWKVRKAYCQNTSKPLMDLLKYQLRRKQPLKVDKHVESYVAMITCSDPPEGRARWTLRMMADRMVQLQVVDSICAESVRKALSSTHLKPWRGALLGYKATCEIKWKALMTDLSQPKPLWMRIMSARRRKILAVCRPCHMDIQYNRPKSAEKGYRRAG